MKKNLSNKGPARIATSKAVAGGFTLIELLVVIAIIGVLASVVLASLGGARKKSNDTAVKQNLSNARQQADLFYLANNNSYVGVCLNGTAGNVPSIYPMLLQAAKANSVAGGILMTGASTATNIVCASNANGWAATVPLKNPPTGTAVYCVDWKGHGGAVAAGTINANTDFSCL